MKGAGTDGTRGRFIHFNLEFNLLDMPADGLSHPESFFHNRFHSYSNLCLEVREGFGSHQIGIC